ncbi:hypothetical protein AB0K34_14075 [Actinomadura sp. NPDC049382]|uniref:hypothetical protein n=1 Tax=Actinomadura sp. NPDC049382 TaxID=3158220 RepID=UPI0034431AE1
MDPLLLSILITLALRHAIENGKTEYAHIRDQRAAEIARTYPHWSPSRVKRVARRAARQYWWGQIRGGFPEVRAAYAENKELAEAARIEAETAGLQRRAEIRERVRVALEEAEKIRSGGRRGEGTKEGSAEGTSPRQPVPAPDEPAQDDAAEPAPDHSGDPAGPAGPADDAERPAPAAPAEAPSRSSETDQTPQPDGPDTDPATEDPPAAPARCDFCDDAPAQPYPTGGHRCAVCWQPRTAPQPVPVPDLDDGVNATVIPLKPPPAPAAAPSTEGDPMTTVPTGEYTGYEAAVANWNAIQRLSQQLLSHYEALMASYRGMNVDDPTIGRAAACHEAEEQHLIAVQAASGDFLSRHGAVKETKEATATTGDQAVYNS